MMKTSVAVESRVEVLDFGGRAQTEAERPDESKSKERNKRPTDLLILLVLEKRGYLCPWEKGNAFSRSTTEACVESFCVRPRLTYFFDDEMEEIGRWD